MPQHLLPVWEIWAECIDNTFAEEFEKGKADTGFSLCFLPLYFKIKIIYNIKNIYDVRKRDEKVSLILRKAEKKDADAIAEIEAERFSKPWSKASVLSEIENPSSVVICAENDGEIVGYGGLQTVLDEGYITNIAVRKRNERKGIASVIVEAIIESAKERKLSFVSLEVRESNFAAQGLYLKYGFETVGKRTNFYEKPAEDALIMTKNL